MLGASLAMDYHPTQGGVAILLVAAGCRHRVTPRQFNESDFQSESRWFEPGLPYRDVSLDKKLRSTLSQSPPRCVNRYQRHNAGGKPCDGLSSYLGGGGGVAILLVAACCTHWVTPRIRLVETYHE